MIRKLLGWVDEDGNPVNEQIRFSRKELIAQVGISRGDIAKAFTEALENHLIRQVDGSDVEPAYTLCWSDVYTDSLDDFLGFFQPEAMIVQGDNGKPHARVAKAARKNIPNAFFDYVLRRERLSVIQVVGTLLFKSITWGPGGERKDPVPISVRELCKLTNFAPRHVHQALVEAMKRGYIERTEVGRFDPNAGAKSIPSVYRIRWTSEPVSPVVRVEKPSSDGLRKTKVPYPFLDESNMGYGGGVQNGIRGEDKKGYESQPKKGYDISLKSRSIKNKTTAEPRPEAPTVAAASGVLEKLIRIGFDLTGAQSLTRRFSAEVIDQQLAWLPQRKADTNRLGLLRRAIEGNWSQPEASAPPPEYAAGALFVRHFDAVMLGYGTPPSSCSFKEAEQATAFLRELVQSGGNELQSAEWGRRFAKFARTKAPAKPCFGWVFRAHGDEFLRRSRQAGQRDEQISAVKSRRAHHLAFAAHYEDYLRERERVIQREQPAVYAAFERHREETNNRFKLLESTRKLLASETGRLSAFVLFMNERGLPVFDFWAWDRQLNPQGWKEDATIPKATTAAPAR